MQMVKIGQLRYFVAQIYLDLYKQTGSKEYLQKAYDIALNNVNVLVESQKRIELSIFIRYSGSFCK